MKVNRSPAPCQHPSSRDITIVLSQKWSLWLHDNGFFLQAGRPLLEGLLAVKIITFILRYGFKEVITHRHALLWTKSTILSLKVQKEHTGDLSQYMGTQAPPPALTSLLPCVLDGLFLILRMIWIIFLYTSLSHQALQGTNEVWGEFCQLLRARKKPLTTEHHCVCSIPLEDSVVVHSAKGIMFTLALHSMGASPNWISFKEHTNP